MIKRIAYHWSAGSYTRSYADFLHYHFTINDAANVQPGLFKPNENTPPLRPGQYAAHLGGGNSYTLGIAFLGMSKDRGHGNWAYPLTRMQCERGWKLGAEWCIRNGILVRPETVFSHYEFGKKNPTGPSRGKIDITVIPYEPELRAEDVGEYIREKVRWYIRKEGV